MSLIFPPFSSGFLNDEEYLFSRKLRDRQSKAVKQAFVSFRSSLVESQQIYNLYDIKNALIERGVPDSELNHLRNNIIDRLDVNYRNIHVELSIALFPKRNYAQVCKIEVKSCDITESIELTYTPESIAVFILSVIDWLQEYDKIEIQLKQELKQEVIAKEISLDLLKRAAGDILDRKGYVYDVYAENWSNKASLRIGFEGDFTMTFEVNLLEDFIDKVAKVIESLPDNQKEQLSMLGLKNILHCAVIEDFNEDLISSLKKGGNNVIIHNGLLWIPNMCTNACKAADIKRIYTKDDILPHTAPIDKLKAYDAKLDEFMEGYSERERHNFLKRLVDGVGFAGHYNRHRFKMPEDFYDPSSEV